MSVLSATAQSARSAFVIRLAVAIAVSVAVATVGWSAAAVAPTAASPVAQKAPAPPDRTAASDRSVIPDDQRDKVLGSKWKSSDDKIVVGRGDDTGFHVLMATERSGFKWTTLASLSEPGFDTDRWIGNTCLTGDGSKVAVVYGPRTFANDAALMQRGGFAAIVDIDTREVTMLPFNSTLAYFNPGCGSGSKVTFTRFSDNASGPAKASTEIKVVNSDDAHVDSSTRVEGQISSAVVNGSALVAAAGPFLVRVSNSGQVVRLAKTRSTPHHIVASGDRGFSYLDSSSENTSVMRIADAAVQSTPTELATGKSSQLTLRQGPGKEALLVGKSTPKRKLPSSITQISVERSQTSSWRGHAVVTENPTPAPYTSPGGKKPSRAWEAAMTLDKVDPGMPTPVKLSLTIPKTGKSADFVVEPAPYSESASSDAPASSGAAGRGQGSPTTAEPESYSSSVASTSSSTIDSDALCSIPRNDPNTQVYQPTPRQVEWATNQAVTNNLNVTRSANWKQAGMASAWSPQGLFPSTALSGGGRVPTQVMLGILAQESNLWQASGHSLSGIPGNPLVGNYYGTDIYDPDPDHPHPEDDFDIEWSQSDCGYGVAQITDEMRKGGSLSTTQQRAVAVDYATNIAAGLQILQGKWNETRAAGAIHDNGDPASLENWVFAIWAYNSGFHPTTGGGPWGVGWLNNPANPIYDPSRLPFGQVPSDAAHPQDWPYQEKVIGFAAYSIATLDGPGFRPAWWVSVTDQNAAKPPTSTFCTAANDCNFGSSYTPNAPEVSNSPAGPCAHQNSSGQYDLKCWWHTPVSYNWCGGGYCGHELLRFNSTYPEQPDGTNNPPVCSNEGLPSGALVVDDVPTSAAPIDTSLRPCSSGGTNSGSLNFEFPETSSGKSPARIDFHQSGAGYRGHVWWAHTRSGPRAGVDLDVKGTWKFNTTLNQWGRVLVHIPDYAAHTQQAKYVIDDGSGVKESRFVLQRTRTNGWISLGVIDFNGQPEISLSSHTFNGTGNDDIAWDAVAIQPLSSKPGNFVVALGDSYTSGEGASLTTGSGSTTNYGADYYRETNYGGNLDDDAGRNACHRSTKAWPRKVTLTDSSTPLGDRADAWDTNVDFQFHACSGARTQNINANETASSAPPANALGEFPVGQFGEVTQIDKGYLDSNTTLVMLSLGGNDARFADVIKKCMLGSCPLDTLSGDSSPMLTAVPARINGGVKDSLKQTLRQIHDRAPNAKVMLMGYPPLITSNGCVAGLSSDEADWLNSVASNSMTPMMSGVAGSLFLSDGIDITFADPTDEFVGKAVCGSPAHIRSVVTDLTESDKPSWVGLFPPSTQSFHPNTGGTTTYATAAKEALDAMGV